MKIAFVFNQKRDSGLDEAEFDTPEVIRAISLALANGGKNQILDIEMTKNAAWVNELRNAKPDLIFNTAEGFYGIGRESLAPIVFEQLQLPYVGSGPYSCFLTLDKFLTKQMVASKGVPTPESFFISEKKDVHIIAKEIQYPVFVKPNFEGSSKGITAKSICQNNEALLAYATECLKRFPEGILVEKYIEGKDVTISYLAGIGDNGVLDPIEYSGPKCNGEWIYDFDLKNIYDDQVDLICPANIDLDCYKKIVTYMKKVVNILAVNDMGRADFRVCPNGDIFFIEFNALPSLQPGAGLFAATNRIGLDYTDTIQAIVTAAVKRLKLKKSRLWTARKIENRNPRFALVYNLKRKTHADRDYEDEAEFDSEPTVEAIKCAIEANGYETIKIEADRNLSHNLLESNIDVVFNIAEGLYKQAREAQVPALCDLLNIEHTGSDASCLALTLNKSITNRVMASEGILVPKSKVVAIPFKKLTHSLNFPIIVKPNMEGTSKGIYDSSVVENDQELLLKAADLGGKIKTPLLLEEYILGKEITVGLIGGIYPKVLGILEIKFKTGRAKYPVYSFAAKQLENQLENEIFTMVCPAQLDKRLEKRIIQFARKAYVLAGCRDVARIDLRIAENGKIYFLEINPLPGLSPGFSDLTIIAQKTGMSYETLIGNILKPAVARWRKTNTNQTDL